MNREGLIKTAKDRGWNRILIDHKDHITEDFLEEFIPFFNHDTMLQSFRVSWEFLDRHKGMIGKKLYKKYKAIYTLIDISKEDGDPIYSDIVNTFMSNDLNVNEALEQYLNDKEVYKDKMISLISNMVKDYYDDIGTKNLDKEFYVKTSEVFIDIHDFFREEGFFEIDSIKEYFQELKDKGKIYRASVFTTEFVDLEDPINSILVVSFSSTMGVSNIHTSFKVPITLNIDFFV